MNPDPRVVADTVADEVAALLVAQAHAELRREEAEAIQAKLLADRVFADEDTGACGSAIPSGRERLWLEELELLAEQLVCLQGTGHERLDAHLAELLPEADASLTRACFLSSDRAWNEAGERFAVIASLTEPPSALGRLSRRLALRCAIGARDERRACELFMVYEAELHKLPVEGPFLLPALETILTEKPSAIRGAASVVHEDRDPC